MVLIRCMSESGGVDSFGRRCIDLTMVLNDDIQDSHPLQSFRCLLMLDAAGVGISPSR